jgi:gliding motility-associated-like protein
MKKWLFLFAAIIIFDVTFNSIQAQVSPLCVPQTPTESIKNGGFEDGIGAPATFGPHNLFIGPGYSGSGQYYVGKSPKYFNIGFPNDFLPNGGNNMLMVDAAVLANSVCWQQTVNIIPNRLYFFSAYIRSLSNGERCQLQFQISVNNGATWSALGAPQMAPLPDEPWLQIFESWHSGINSTAILRLSNFNPGGFGYGGNDFAIDDISFKDLCLDPTLGSKPTMPASIPLCGKPSVSIPTNIATQSAVKFTWYDPDGVIVPNSNVPTLTGVTKPGTYTVCVDSNTCLQSGTSNIVSTLTINLGLDANLCNPATKVLNTGIDPVVAGNFTIKWFKDGIQQSAYDGMVSITVDAPGTYKVEAQDINNIACNDSDEIIITSSLPVPHDVEFCGPNQTVTLTVDGTAATYRWYTTPTGFARVIPVDPAGKTYTFTPPVGGVTYYLADPTMVPACQRVEVKAKVAPNCCYALTGTTITPSISGDVCAGTLFNLTYSGGQAGDSLVLQRSVTGAGIWTNVDRVKLSDPYTFTGISSTNTSDFRVVTFSNGAFATAQCKNNSILKTVTVAISPVAGTAAIDKTTICDGGSFKLTLSGYTGSIQWQRSVNGGAFADIGGATADTYTDNPTSNLSPVKYRAVVKISGASCPSVNSNEVEGKIYIATAGTNLIPSVTGNICAGSVFTITYKDGQKGDSLMLQRKVGAGIWTNIDTVKLSDPYTFTGISIINSSEFRVVTFSNGTFANAQCTATSSLISVTVATSPVAGTAAIDNTTICDGGSFRLTLSGYTGSIQWQRSVNGGAFADIGGATADTYTDNPASNLSPVKYRAVVKISGASCPSVNSNEVVGKIFLANAGISLLPSVIGDICAGSVFTITYKDGQKGDSLMLQRKVGAGSWTNIDTVKLTDPYTFSGISINNNSEFRVVTFSNGTFTTAQCINYSSVLTVNLAISPVAGTASISSAIVCKGQSVNLTLTGSAGSIQWQRAYGTSNFENISGATTVNYSDVPTQTPVQYKATVGGSSCPNVISNTVKADLSEVISGSISGTSKVCDAKSVILSLNGSKGTIQWQDSSGGIWANLPGQTSSSITYNPSDTITIDYLRVIVTDPTGTCNPVSSTKFIIVSDSCASGYPIYLPNALTPNGDGSNDVFYIGNIELYPRNHLTIFNRWGSKVFDTVGYNNDWDGGDLPVATYYYVLELGKDSNGNTNEKDRYQGTVTIVR